MHSYSINVARNGFYVYRIEMGQMLESNAKSLFEMTCPRYPASEGFHLTLHKATSYSETVAYSEGA